jgi:hypothetical protein
MPDNHEAELWIELAPGKAIRLRATVFEYGLPTPGEADVMRQPDFNETLTILRQIKIEQVHLKQPF